MGNDRPGLTFDFEVPIKRKSIVVFFYEELNFIVQGRKDRYIGRLAGKELCCARPRQTKHRSEEVDTFDKTNWGSSSQILPALFRHFLQQYVREAIWDFCQMYISTHPNRVKRAMSSTQLLGPSLSTAYPGFHSECKGHQSSRSNFLFNSRVLLDLKNQTKVGPPARPPEYRPVNILPEWLL